MYIKNAAGQFVCFSMISTTNGAPVTGITPTCRRCIDGTFADATGTITEDTGLGFYKMALSQADTNGNNIAYRFIGTGAIDTTINIVTTPGVYRGTVDDGSTTTIEDAGLTSAQTDNYNGRVVVFLTGNLAGQATLITAFNAGTDTLTVNTLTATVTAGDTYLIV